MAETVVRLMEVAIKMKFGAKGDTLKRCEKAGVRIHIETEAEYNNKRAMQEASAASTGLNLERYGRKNAVGDIIYDPGVQIINGKDVKLDQFVSDMKTAGFLLVDLEVFQGFGKQTDAYFFTSTFARDERAEFPMTPEQEKIQKWFFSRIFGSVYVWRNFGGAQLDIPAIGIRLDPEVKPIAMRMYRDGRQIRIGSENYEVAFEGDETTVTA